MSASCHTSGLNREKNTPVGNLPVVEIFSTIQGEGYHTGKAASFIRLAGCDLACNWCDSKSSWNAQNWPMLSVEAIVQRVDELGISDVIISGGEPLSNDLTGLCNDLKNKGFRTYLETSGAYPLTGTWDWICLSPKQQSPPLPEIFLQANELKVVIGEASDLIRAEEESRKVPPNCLRYLQPEWSVRKTIIPVIVDHILKNPSWMLSLQSHKFIGIP